MLVNRRGERVSDSRVHVRIVIAGLSLRRRRVGRVDRVVRRAGVLFAVWKRSVLGRRYKDGVADSHSLGTVFADLSGVVRSVGRRSDSNCDVDSSGRDKNVVGRTLDGWLKSCRVNDGSSRVLGRHVAVDGSVLGRSIVIDRSSNSRLSLKEY
jgi:hypothetical protein